MAHFDPLFLKQEVFLQNSTYTRDSKVGTQVTEAGGPRWGGGGGAQQCLCAHAGPKQRGPSWAGTMADLKGDRQLAFTHLPPHCGYD